MRTKVCSRILTLILIVAAALGGCGKRDDVIAVESDDPEMEAAIAKARETLPEFWSALEARREGESGFSLKVRMEYEGDVEHIWVGEIERRDGKIMGTIDNDPDALKNVKLGDRIEIKEADISDWTYLRNGKIVGNETLRPLLKHMPADEAAAVREKLADP